MEPGLLVLVLLIAVVIAAGLARRRGLQRPFASTVGKRGVGGWLLLLCVQITILMPIGVLIAVIGIMSDDNPALRNLLLFDTVVSTGLAAFGVYAGIMLWRIRPGAIRATQIFLIMFAGYAVFRLAVLPSLFDMSTSMREAVRSQLRFNSSALATISIIWYQYLDRSARVRLTYNEPSVSLEARLGRLIGRLLRSSGSRSQ